MSQLEEINTQKSEWKDIEKIAFRFFFLFFSLQILPIDWKFYRELFSIDFGIKSIFDLTRYTTQFISAESLPKWGIGSFANWGIFFLIAIIGTIAWSYKDRERKEYNNLYYWLRVILRYRLAIGIIAFGFLKLFPLQIPYPSLSNLHTNYGDFFAWKIYYHTLGIAPNYESFLGLVEILAGFLLFCRKTVTFGAGLIIGFTGNVLVANFAYDIGEHVYSSFLVLTAFFLFVHDIPRLFSLLALEKGTLPNTFQPTFSEEWLKKTRKGLRIAFGVFVVFFGIKTYANFKSDPYLTPHNPGLKGAYGFYNVSEFVQNNDTIPYSLTDPNRWQNVVFEKWSTLSIKIARPIKIDVTNGDGQHKNDIDRNYESAGVAGRHYFHYEIDSLAHTLSLQNKNQNHKNEKWKLAYNWPNDSTLVLAGTNEKNDSVHLVLDKVNKKYMMLEGRRKPVKL